MLETLLFVSGHESKIPVMNIEDRYQALAAALLTFEPPPFQYVPGYLYQGIAETSSAYYPDGHWFPLHVAWNMAYTPFMSDVEIDLVLRHELAHCVTGPHAGHGIEWQAQAVAFGTSPEEMFLLERWYELPYAVEPLNPVPTIEKLSQYAGIPFLSV